jgi:hypothetical protein
MKSSIKRLSEFLNERPDPPVRTEDQLTLAERNLFRSLKTMGERAVRGRDIERYLFDVKFRGEQATLRMVMEGRHSMSIAHQVVRRFEGRNELEFVNAVKTKKGAKVILRPVYGEIND